MAQTGATSSNTAGIGQYGRTWVCIWAEENGGLSTATNSGWQWAYGNGANTPTNQGILVPFDCEIQYAFFSVFGTPTTAQIGIEVNGSIVGTINANGGGSKTQYMGAIAVSAGSVINFKTTSFSGTSVGPNTVGVWLVTDVIA